ncbi:hypothetical protein KCU95_g12853, partial [Aureobasidium melanogenum]
MAHRIASLLGRALPLLAHTISLRPSCTWNSDIFLNVKVDYLDTPQQPNSWDCGKCTAMHLIHTLREEPQEDINHGKAFWFFYAALISDVLLGSPAFSYTVASDPPLGFQPWSTSLLDPTVSAAYTYLPSEEPLQANKTALAQSQPSSPTAPPTVSLANLLESMPIYPAGIGLQMPLWIFLCEHAQASTRTLIDNVLWNAEDPEWTWTQLINRSSRDDSGNPASPEYLLRWLLQMSPHFVPLGADMWSAAHNTSGRRQQKKEFKFAPSSGIRSVDPRDICEILSTSMSPQKTASVIANAANRSYTLVAFVERYSGESVIHLFFLDKLRAYWEYTFLRNATSLIEAGYQCNNNTGPSFWEFIDS